MRTAPEAVAQMLVAADLWLGPTWEIVVAGEPSKAATQRVLAALYQSFDSAPGPGLSRPTDRSATIVGARPALCRQGRNEAEPTAYICEGFACQAPEHGVDNILARWQSLADPRWMKE